MIDLYADNAYRFVVKQLRDEASAQDIIQDVFEKVWLKRKDISFEKCKSYLFTSAYRTMVDWIRKNKKVSFEEDISSAHSYEHQSSDLKDHLDKAFELLPEIQKTTIMLRDYEGYDYKEIGSITGLTESQVKVYIYRARKKLQAYLISVDTIL